jgi:IS30 family transposase
LGPSKPERANTAKNIMPLSFANPYSSWECGLNKHTNGSKQMAFDHLSQKQVNKAVALLNNQPK